MQALSRRPDRPSRRRGPARSGLPAGAGPRPSLVDLAHAADPGLVGAKAAALAAAHRLGLPVLPGFVLTTDGSAALAGGSGPAAQAEVRSLLARAWSDLSGGGTLALVVRSSSPGEDGATSSMAGRYTSVLGVVDGAGFVAAVHRVIASAGEGEAGGAAPPMAVLVQPQVFPRWGGVLFGVDPVTGRAGRFVLAAVEGGPDRLVSGAVNGSRSVVSPRGRLVGPAGRGPRLPAGHRRALARLARRAARAFGGPQDIEWAVVDGRGVVLLQTRPVTAVGGAAAARGPVLGPGPVAETFPDALAPLEAGLWLPPLRRAVAEAVLLTGAASARRVRRSPVVTLADGRAAADLDLLGVAPRRASLAARLDPRPPALRLRAAWRTGRLRSALPALGADLLRRADAELASVPDPAGMDDAALLAVLRGAGPVLAALHAHEVLAGMLADRPGVGPGGSSGAGAALRALDAARREGFSDAAAVAARPEVLALLPPAIAPRGPLPDLIVAPPPAAGPGDPLAELREGLRLRVRWAHELTAVVALELGGRLARRDLLARAAAVRWLTPAELEAAVAGGTAPSGVAERSRAPLPAPLPSAFRLTPAGAVVPVDLGGGAGQGAGGGRALGPVADAAAGPPRPGDVLVTRTLDPGLAAVLPGLAGLVSETGSVLSHLAILARELGVPTVVAVPGALERFPPGSVVVVDGTTGEVSALETVAGR